MAGGGAGTGRTCLALVCSSPMVTGASWSQIPGKEQPQPLPPTTVLGLCLLPQSPEARRQAVWTQGSCSPKVQRALEGGIPPPPSAGTASQCPLAGEARSLYQSPC